MVMRNWPILLAFNHNLDWTGVAGMGARVGKYQKKRSLEFEKTPCIGLAHRLVPVQYRGFENGLFGEVALKMLYFLKKLLTAKLALL